MYKYIISKSTLEDNRSASKCFLELIFIKYPPVISISESPDYLLPKF